jgi:hypothetical protein
MDFVKYGAGFPMASAASAYIGPDTFPQSLQGSAES